jgi:hypothetical protein
MTTCHRCTAIVRACVIEWVFNGHGRCQFCDHGEVREPMPGGRSLLRATRGPETKVSVHFPPRKRKRYWLASC